MRVLGDHTRSTLHGSGVAPPVPLDPGGEVVERKWEVKTGTDYVLYAEERMLTTTTLVIWSSELTKLSWVEYYLSTSDYR